MKRINTRITAALLCWVGFASAVTAQESVRLEWKPQPGQSWKSRIMISHLSPIGLIQVNYPTTEKIIDIQEERVIVERVNGEPEVKVDGQPNSEIRVGAPDRKLHLTRDGGFLLAEGASKRGGRLESFFSLAFSPQPVRRGDTWVYGQDDNLETGARKARFIFRYGGSEVYYGIDAHRVEVDFSEAAAPDATAGRGVVWLSQKDGSRLGEVYYLENADMGMGPMRIKVVREPYRENRQLALEAVAGRWKGEFTAVSGDLMEIWMDVQSGAGQPSLTLDLVAAESPYSRKTSNHTNARFEAGNLLWKLNLFGENFDCTVKFHDFLSAVNHCRTDSSVLSVEMARTLESPWVPADMEVAGGNAEQQPFVHAFRDAVLAVAADNFEQFDQLFVDNPKGMQPNEIWRAASRVLTRFGKIRRIEFSKIDPPGAYLLVQFDRATREFFVQLDPSGKIQELTYVPPATPHEH